jgi:hypothetical protein
VPGRSTRALDRMVNVSASAKSFIESRCAEEGARSWYLIIEWRLGEMENSRAADGSSIWRREPDKGWGVELVGYGPEVGRELGEPLLPEVRVIVAPSNEHPFPGGTITFEDGWLKVVPHAI